MDYREERNRVALTALYLVSAFMGFAFLATACRPSLTAAEKVHFLMENDPECNRPCLSGILPGETTESQLLRLIADGSSQQFDDLRTNNNPITGTRYSWRDRRSSFTAYANVKFNLVRYAVLQTSPDIPIETFIRVMGSPDSYAAEYGCGEQCGIWLYLFYEQFGLFTASLIPAVIPAIPEGEICRFTVPTEAVVDRIYLIPKVPASEIEPSLAPSLTFGFEQIHPWAGLELNAVSCLKP